jgi:aerobic carbon-monoxide dehydrogenase medium subunit
VQGGGRAHPGIGWRRDIKLIEGRLRVKPAAFEYADPETVEEALALLQRFGGEAKILAGGQSLVPMMAFRLVRPGHIIDVNRIRSLDYVTATSDGGLVIGAMTRQEALERSPEVKARVPLLAEAAPYIGHTAIRNRGTIGGSLAHADPAAELPAVVTALGATLVIGGTHGKRVSTAAEFFRGYLATSLEPSELLLEIRIPPSAPRTGTAFLEVSRRHGDFALVAIAVSVTLDRQGTCAAAAVVGAGVGPGPVRLAVENVLQGERPTPGLFEHAAASAQASVSPDSDLHASAEYRKHVTGVLTRRALAIAFQRATGEAR